MLYINQFFRQKGPSFHQGFFALCLLALVSLSSCRQDTDFDTGEIMDMRLQSALSDASKGVGVDFFLMPQSNDLTAIPQDPKNPLTSQKVSLGKMLYHETGFALNPKLTISKETYGCASCHLAPAGFQAGVIQGLGEGGIGCGDRGEGRIVRPGFPLDSVDNQPLRTPSAMNVAYQKNVLWNGQLGATGVNIGTDALWNANEAVETNFLGYEGLETQAIAGFKIHRMLVDSVLVHSTDYKSLFDAAFPNVPVSERYSREMVGLAIAAYERTLLSNQAPFQLYLRGNKSALTDRQKQGAEIFFGKAECLTCHNGPSLANMEFYALGMNDLNGSGTYGVDPNHDAHLGRFSFTGITSDRFTFKVPQLYNLKDSPFYGHGGSFTSVKDVIEYKNKAQGENSNVQSKALANGFHPLGLTTDEIDMITEFIEEGLYDPNLNRYVPTSIPSGLCFPMNDSLSQVQLGCN